MFVCFGFKSSEINLTYLQQLQSYYQCKSYPINTHKKYKKFDQKMFSQIFK